MLFPNLKKRTYISKNMLRKQWPIALCKEIYLILRSKDQRENYEVRI